MEYDVYYVRMNYGIIIMAALLGLIINKKINIFFKRDKDAILLHLSVALATFTKT